MACYLKILLFGLFALTSCTTYRNKPLTFISDQGLNFKIPEDSLKSKLKIVDSVVYQDNRSFIIGKHYNAIKFRSDRMYSKIYNTYYFSGKQNANVDIVVLYFYKKRLSKIELTTRKPERIDSLLAATEAFYNKKFEIDFREKLTEKDSLTYGKHFQLFLNKPIYAHGNFSQDKITVYYRRNLIFQEVSLKIINEKVKLPSWCGYRFTFKSLLYYLKFWRFF